jgi:hypothetical protein
MLWLTLQLITTAIMVPRVFTHSANVIASPFSQIAFVVSKLKFCYGLVILVELMAGKLQQHNAR